MGEGQTLDRIGESLNAQAMPWPWRTLVRGVGKGMTRRGPAVGNRGEERRKQKKWPRTASASGWAKRLMGLRLACSA